MICNEGAPGRLFMKLDHDRARLQKVGVDIGKSGVSGGDVEKRR
jgi:hypothetical protein